MALVCFAHNTQCVVLVHIHHWYKHSLDGTMYIITTMSSNNIAIMIFDLTLAM